MKKYNIKGTFFVLGKTAQNNPELISFIYKSGHEIASHGYSHIKWNKLNSFNKRKELEKSIEIIKNITGKIPLGFRAPDWSLQISDIDLLIDFGFKYDSSLYPEGVPFWGKSGIKSGIQIIKKNKKALYEVSPGIQSIYKIRFPFIGGMFLKLYPEKIINRFIEKKINNNEYLHVYIHPWEIDLKHPYKFTLNPITFMAHHFNKSIVLKKLENIFKKVRFSSIIEYLKNEAQYKK